MSKPPKYALADWPAPDRAAWEAATSTEVSLFARGNCARWAPETKRQAFYAYSRWLTFLAERHHELLQVAPQDRLTPERLEEFIEPIARRVSAQTVVSTLTHLINALHAIAPNYPTGALRQTQKRYGRRITPRDKRSRMQPAGAVMRLGFELMDQAATIADPRQAARTFRDGLIIAVWMETALRRKNLAALSVGTNLARIGANYRLVVEAKDVKSRNRIDQPLCKDLSPYIETYLNDYRPRFPRALEFDALWLSAKGGPMCPEAIWDAVRRRTLARFGLSINLHLARDMAATSAPSLGSALLSHSNPTMTDQFYRRSDPLAASRKLGAVIAELRAKAATTKVVAHARGWNGATPRKERANEQTKEAIV